MSAMLDFTHAKDDEGKHRRLIFQLKNTGCWELAALLESCAPDRPCSDGACIHCGRALQRQALALIEEQIREPARRERRERMTAITLVPWWGFTWPNDLTATVCWNVTTSVATTLRAITPAPAVAGLDVSFNEDEEGKTPAHWSAHSHVVLAGWLTDAQDEALRAAFPAAPFSRRPVQVEDLDQQDNGPLYAVKPDRIRRVSYLDRTQSNRYPFRNRHRRPLRPDQAVALAQVEHELGLVNRLIIAGIAEDRVRAALKGFIGLRMVHSARCSRGGTAPPRAFQASNPSTTRP